MQVWDYIIALHNIQNDKKVVFEFDIDFICPNNWILQQRTLEVFVKD